MEVVRKTGSESWHSLPVFERFAPELSFARGVLKPFLSTSAGYSQSNIGSMVKYVEGLQGDPLPRVTRVGLGSDA